MRKLFVIFLIAAITWIGCKNKDNSPDKNISQTYTAADSEIHIPVDTQKIQIVHYYKPNYTLLYGKLVRETFFGAPGYGSTPDKDKKEDLYFLVPDRPFDVRTSPKSGAASYDDIDNIRKIQLISLTDLNNKLLAGAVNRDVVVKGMLIRNKGEHKPSEVAMELIGIH